MVIQWKENLDPITENFKELTITPFLSLPTGGSGVAKDENGQETVINQIGISLKEVDFIPFTLEIE